jgi:hypothetical protein
MWAFSDESERAAVMLMTVVTVPPARVEIARATMRSLLLPGERRIHAAKESPPRRRQILDHIARSDQMAATVLRYRRLAGIDRVTGRKALIEATTNLVVESSVSLWTLDDIPPSQRSRDRNIIGHALARAGAHQIIFDHRRSHEEPLLWAADAICWAVGAGGDWRRRVQPIVTIVDVDP